LLHDGFIEIGIHNLLRAFLMTWIALPTVAWALNRSPPPARFLFTRGIIFEGRRSDRGSSRRTASPHFQRREPRPFYQIYTLDWKVASRRVSPGPARRRAPSSGRQRRGHLFVNASGSTVASESRA
jgi:hypothetical protein